MIRLYGDNPPDELFSEYYQRTNGLLMDIAFRCLRAGVDIILDAGFWKRKDRDEIRQEVQEAGANYQLIYVKTSEKIMRERVLKRNQNQSKTAFFIDDAAMDNFKQRIEPLAEDEDHIVVDGGT
jgi:predicted kinase